MSSFQGGGGHLDEPAHGYGRRPHGPRADDEHNPGEDDLERDRGEAGFDEQRDRVPAEVEDTAERRSPAPLAARERVPGKSDQVRREGRQPARSSSRSRARPKLT